MKMICVATAIIVLLELASAVPLAASHGTLTSDAWPDCSVESDGHGNSIGDEPFGPVAMFNMTWEDSLFWVYHPTSTKRKDYPIVVFMHGSASAPEMYAGKINHHAATGFAVVYPFIKDPVKDHNPLTTNTNGKVLMKGVSFATEWLASAVDSPLAGRLDASRVVIMGHSMGASDVIQAASKLPKGSLKLAITQHPGICGPFGPPPLPATYTKKQMTVANENVPFLFTSAHNDGAFWPAPYTAEHEEGCFANMKQTAVFASFTEKACNTSDADPWWPVDYPEARSGHDCAMKSKPETPWVTTALKLFAHHDSSEASACHALLWGEGAGSMATDANIEKLHRQPPA